MPVQGIIFFDIFINIAQCATASVVKAENSNGAILVATYAGGGRIDINLPANYDTAFAEWQRIMRGLQAPTNNGHTHEHQHGDSMPHSH